MNPSVFDDAFWEIAADPRAMRELLLELHRQETAILSANTEAPFPLADDDIARVRLRIANASRLLGDDQQAVETYDLVLAHYRSLETQKAAFMIQLKRTLAVFNLDPDAAFQALNNAETELSIDPQLEVYRQFIFEYRARFGYQTQNWEMVLENLNAALDLPSVAGKRKSFLRRWLVSAERKLSLQ